MSRYEMKMKDGSDLSLGWDWAEGFFAHISDVEKESKDNPSGIVVQVGGVPLAPIEKHLLAGQVVTELSAFVEALGEAGVQLSRRTLAQLQSDKDERGSQPTPLQANVMKMFAGLFSDEKEIQDEAQ